MIASGNQLFSSASSNIQVKELTKHTSRQAITFASMFQSVCSISKSVNVFAQNQITLSRVIAVAGLGVAAYFVKNKLQRSKLIAHKAKQSEKQEKCCKDLPSSSFIPSSDATLNQTCQESPLDLTNIIAPNAFTDMMHSWEKQVSE